MDEIWEWFEFLPQEIRDLGDRVFVISTQRLRGHTSGVDVEERSGVVCQLRDGLFTELRSYPTVAEALAATGHDQAPRRALGTVTAVLHE